MKIKKSKILIIVVFVLGLTILLYPVVSMLISSIFQTKVIKNYNYSVEQMEKDKMDKELQKAQEYNDKIKSVTEIIKDPFTDKNSSIPSGYKEILDVNGVIGYIEIPKININVPIYHGSTDDVLAMGIGHLETTGFPIGGLGNHSVLSGHRGLPTAKMFTDLDKMEVGDNFFIHVLDQTLEYKVDQIKVIDPSDTSDLMPVPDKDYVTLLTCTPLGINSHRLIVRGERVEYNDSENEPIPFYKHKEFYLIVVAILVILSALIIWIIKKRRKEQNEN